MSTPWFHSSAARAAIGSEHPDVGYTMINLSDVAAEQGKADLSLEWGRRALAILEKSVGQQHPSVGILLSNMGETLRDVGRCDDMRIYTNDQATKANMEEAIARWLPSVSRPGDTIFILFSGHTGQLPDREGDEPDGQDEYFVPHDFIDANIFSVLWPRYQNEGVPVPVAQRLEHLAGVVRQAGDNAAEALTIETCVTDDLLARWLQRLPRLGWGFQLPLVAGYGFAILKHRLAGAPYPLLNHVEAERPAGVFAVEPHFASGAVGAKFESVLVLDGDETRWLDPGLFGEVQG